ncbi:MAG TPA: DUF1772 domain-containing protein [Chryseolinea sp.]|nr:DUF1772 domain-containing protein [Chryseolinea sp.]
MQSKFSPVQLARVFSLLLTGFIAGTFFYGTFTVIPTFYEVPPSIHLSFRTALMHHNVVIVMSLVVSAIAVLVVYSWHMRKVKIARTLCYAALIFTIVSLVITRVGSVPINMEIKTWSPASPPQNWLTILRQWDFYNLIRTITSIGSFVCLLVADIWVGPFNKNHV